MADELGEVIDFGCLSHFLFLFPILDLKDCTHLLLPERMGFQARTDQTVKQEKEAKMQNTVINAAGMHGRNLLAHTMVGYQEQCCSCQVTHFTFFQSRWLPH